jgi:AraC family transcriptional regulator of adaptative response/methylated-DNA-[protein]-cysteine methyltransferase
MASAPPPRSEACSTAPAADPWPARLALACRRIEALAPAAGVETVAGELEVSPGVLHRRFREHLGTTPKAYAQALALMRLCEASGSGQAPLEAALDAGFQSPSAAYRLMRELAGESPARLGSELQIGWWCGLSDLGWMMLAATTRGICWLSFAPDAATALDELARAFPRARLSPEEMRLSAWFNAARQQILLPREALALPLDIQGTAFQARVWTALREIPLGQTRSYGELARQVGQPGGARATGAACGRNPVAVLIPCHRVVGGSGALTGYRWGVERKARLLEREAAASA